MFPCFRVLGGLQGPVFCVFVFWAGTMGLCFVFSCFGRPPSKHSRGPNDYLNEPQIYSTGGPCPSPAHNAACPYACPDNHRSETVQAAEYNT